MNRVLRILCVLALASLVPLAFAGNAPEAVNDDAPRVEARPSYELDYAPPPIGQEVLFTQAEPVDRFGAEGGLPCGAKCANNGACASGSCAIPFGCYTGFCDCE